jgi:hypothetical protein
MSTPVLRSHHAIGTITELVHRIRLVWQSRPHPTRTGLLAPSEVDRYPWAD